MSFDSNEKICRRPIKKTPPQNQCKSKQFGEAPKKNQCKSKVSVSEQKSVQIRSISPICAVSLPNHPNSSPQNHHP
jgi:hypothetical protein